MSLFEFQFALFAVLMGFILVEVLSGLMRTLRTRLPSAPGVKADIRIGWLTPMLGAFVMLDIVGWWTNVWNIHEVMVIGYDTTLAGLILSTIYYYAASMVFPDEPRNWPDIDEWFWLHRRQVLAVIFGANMAWLPTFPLLQDVPLALWIVVNGLYLTLLAIAAIAGKRWIVTTALALLIAENLSFAPMEIMHRAGFW